MVTLKNQNDKMSWLINESLQDDTYFPHFLFFCTFGKVMHLELCALKMYIPNHNMLWMVGSQYWKKKSFYFHQKLFYYVIIYITMLLNSGIFFVKSKSKQKLISHFCKIGWCLMMIWLKFFFRYRLDLMMLPPYLLFNCLLFIFDIDLSDWRWTLSIIRQNCMTKTYPFPEPDWNSNTFPPSSVVLTWESFKYLWHLTRIGKENGVWS